MTLLLTSVLSCCGCCCCAFYYYSCATLTSSCAFLWQCIRFVSLRFGFFLYFFFLFFVASYFSPTHVVVCLASSGCSLSVFGVACFLQSLADCLLSFACLLWKNFRFYFVIFILSQNFLFNFCLISDIYYFYFVVWYAFDTGVYALFFGYLCSWRIPTHLQRCRIQ